MSSKYIVRQPIKDQANKIIGYEIQYHGENQAFGDNGKNVRENDFAAADTIYNFLTMNTDKLLRGSLNFMTFTTTLLMKKTPHLFDKGELVIQIDDSVINAAQDLGANTFQTFIKIWLPLSLPGVISGITMVFVPSLTTFVISDLLGGSKILLIGNVIEQEFTKGSNWNLGAGLSIVLMVFILLSMTMIAKYDKDGEGSAF